MIRRERKLLTNGGAIVAALGLTREASRFLRAEIARRWAEDGRLPDVSETLQRHDEGACFAQEASVRSYSPNRDGMLAS